MKAALFESVGRHPEIREIDDPVAEAGDVVVDVAAAPVLAYHHEVFAGTRPMLFALPFVPGTGAVGRVASLGAGATELKQGDWVYCDPTLRARDGIGLSAISLQGLTAGGPDALPVWNQFPDGSWATQLRLPLENAIALGDIEAQAAAHWLTLGTMLVPYGGLKSVELQAGEIVVVNGATGSFGSAAVAVALAMGAARVIATGRNEGALRQLRGRFGDRVVGVAVGGDEDANRAAIMAAAGVAIDIVFDILPPGATPQQVKAAIMSVRPGGRVSLMGGVGMAGRGGGLDLPYAWLMRNNITLRGQWMYPRNAIAPLIALVKAGLLSLEGYAIAEFPLDEVEAAIAHAAANRGPFSKTVLRP